MRAFSGSLHPSFASEPVHNLARRHTVVLASLPLVMPVQHPSQGTHPNGAGYQRGLRFSRNAAVPSRPSGECR